MSAIKLQSLELSAFRSFSSPSSVEFPETGLVLVDGENKDTGGSSGSGKSSVNLGVQYALSASGPPATALQSWLTEEVLSVSLKLKVGEQDVLVKRGKKGLSVSVDGEAVNGNTKAADEKLSSLFPFPLKLLETLTYRPQKTRNSFLLLSDADKKEFLSLVLGLDKIESILSASEKNGVELEKKLATQEAVLTALEPQIKTLRSQLRDTQGLSSELDRIKSSRQQQASMLALARESITSIDKQLAESKTSINSRYAALKAAIVPVLPDEQPIVEHRKIVAACQDRVNALELAEAKTIKEQKEKNAAVQSQLTSIAVSLSGRGAVHLRITKIEAEISSLKENRCPTCKQEWIKASARISELETEQASLQKKLLEIEELEKTAPALKAQLLSDYIRPEHHQKMVATLNSLNEKLRGMVQGLESQKRLAQKEVEIHRSDVDVKRLEEISSLDAAVLQQRSAAEAQASAHTLEIGVCDADIKNLESQIAIAVSAEKQIVNLEKQLDDQRQARNETKSALGLELDLQAVLGRTGFLNAIQAEILAEISNETNSILSNIPNVSHVSIQFQTEKTTQKGTVKSVITPVIRVSGQEAPFATGLSGGQQTSVDLAVDLAVIEVVRRRTGAAPNWLILDEPFDGMDFVSKEALMDVLQRFSRNRLILIVDHGTEFKELFSSVIGVRLESGQSSFV